MTGQPETWLFDLGNSRAKLARLDAGRAIEVVAFEWMRPDFSVAVAAQLAAWPAPDRIWVASVASRAHAEGLRRLLPVAHGVETRWLRSPRQACGVRNHYARPERLGIDRFLSMVAVHARPPACGIVVGCGTALTLDALAADGSHVAGMIALSPARMRAALEAVTAIADDNPDAFGSGARDDTALAIDAGCRAAAGALVGWFADRQRGASGDAPVVLHGGWAQELAAWLADDGRRVEVLDDAVLHGLAVWAAHAMLEGT